MAPSDNFDEEEVCILLVGSSDEIAHGLDLINRHLREGMVGWLRQHFPGISPDDRAELWGQTLVNVLEAVRDKRFNADRPLLPWLCQIVKARAVDWVRRHKAQDRLLKAVALALAGTQAGQDWGSLDVLQRREIMALIRQSVGLLPGKQRAVMEVFVDNYPESADMDTLKRLVSEQTGQPETLASVKRALQEARAKSRDFLQQKGYEIGRRGGS